MTETITPPVCTSTAERRDYGRILVWLLFFVSGACGLIYEVLWCRQLGLIFGNTVQSLSAVLTAFMGGLALGSFSAGRLSPRLKRPLLVYGLLEAAIGAYCALLPWALGDSGPVVSLYRLLYAHGNSSAVAGIRFAISFALLLIPTTFMGATLPVLSHYLVRSRQALGRTVGTLYALNSFGAVLGALATGFLLLPVLGKLDTNWCAISGNLALGAVAIGLGWRRGPSPADAEWGQPDVETLSEAPEGPARAAVAVKSEIRNPKSEIALPSAFALRCCVVTFGVTGFAAMATQIGWTRAISLGTGSSTYAFSLIVAFFILGLSLGGMWAARLAPRLADPLDTLAKVLLAIGLSCLALASLLGLSPPFFFVLLAWSSQFNFWAVLAAQALGVGVLIIVPTFLMGATLPLTLQVAGRFSTHAGRTVGNLYAVNTLGAIFGSLFGGLVLLPVLHIQRTLECMALLYALPGVLLFCVRSVPARAYARGARRATLLRAGALTGVVLSALVLAPRWNPLVMSSGSYLLREDHARAIKAARAGRFLAAWPSVDERQEIRYYNEGACASVAVVASGGENLTLRIGGKPDASSTGDMSTQIGLTLLPELLHSGAPREVLVIGLGSGVSAGSALAPDSVEHLEVVEMSPEVVEASRQFRSFNGLAYAPDGSLCTPKVTLRLNDGRNHLLLTRQKYDVIASEPSNPWMAGVGNLFTREAFQLAHDHLKDGGIMCQWIHSYALGKREFYSIVRTFGEVFTGDVQLWRIGPVDFLLLGCDRKIEVDLPKLRERLAQKAVKAWLEKVHFDRDTQLLACFEAPAQMLKLCAGGAPLHTDDNMLLEFAAPRTLYAGTTALNGLEFLPDPERVFQVDRLPESGRGEFLRDLDLAVAARQHLWMAPQSGPMRGLHLQAAAFLSPYTFWVVPQASSLPVVPQASRLPVVPQASSLPVVPQASSLPVVPQASSLPVVPQASSLPVVPQASSLPVVPQASSLPVVPQASSLPVVPQASSLPVLPSLPSAAPRLPVGSSVNITPLLPLIPMELPETQAARAEALSLLREGKMLESAVVLRQALALDPASTHTAAELAAVLLRVGAQMQLSGEGLAAADFVHAARRVSREITVLHPESPAGWEWLCRGFLEEETQAGANARFYHQQAEEAFKNIPKKEAAPADLEKSLARGSL